MTAIWEPWTANASSLQQEARQEAYRHKWIESEKQGWDVGDSALFEWLDRYWSRYCRIRRIEHVIGLVPCRSFTDLPSEKLQQLRQQDDLLFNLILDRIRVGWENLDVLWWGMDWGLPMEEVRDILHEFNINCARLDPPEICETADYELQSA